MIGSIFSNLLLVLGCCFFFGGLKYKEQKFESMVATSNMGLLALSAIAMVLPTQCSAYYELEEDDSLGISRIAAVFLIIMYLQLLVFQLYTHADLFDDEGEEETEMSFSAAIGGLIGITAIITK
jgi:Ca2+:H+ antiporter